MYSGSPRAARRPYPSRSDGGRRNSAPGGGGGGEGARAGRDGGSAAHAGPARRGPRSSSELVPPAAAAAAAARRRGAAGPGWRLRAMAEKVERKASMSSLLSSDHRSCAGFPSGEEEGMARTPARDGAAHLALGAGRHFGPSADRFYPAGVWETGQHKRSEGKHRTGKSSPREVYRTSATERRAGQRD